MEERKPNDTAPAGQLPQGDDDAPSTSSTQPGGNSGIEVPRQPGSHAVIPQSNGTDAQGTSVAETKAPESSALKSTPTQNSWQPDSSKSPSLSSLAVASSKSSEISRALDASQIRPSAVGPRRGCVPCLPATGFDPTPKTTSGAATTGTTDVGMRTAKPVISPSPAATSFLSAESDDAPSQLATERFGQNKAQRQDFETRRARATSAPTQVPSPLPSPSSRGSSKQDIQTTVFGQENLNGDISAKAGTMGRRRSRIRLAFWKKRLESED
jgi:hypothetical protein